MAGGFDSNSTSMIWPLILIIFPLLSIRMLQKYQSPTPIPNIQTSMSNLQNLKLKLFNFLEIEYWKLVIIGIGYWFIGFIVMLSSPKPNTRNSFKLFNIVLPHSYLTLLAAQFLKFNQNIGLSFFKDHDS